MAERWFTDAELKEMGTRTLDRLTAAIEAGDAEKAKKLAKRMYGEFLGMHDLYRNWITETLSQIGRRWGDEVLEEIMTAGVAAWWKPVLANLAKAPPGAEGLKAKTKMFVSGSHGHLQPLEVTEDDEKIEIKLCPCGSGGRLITEGLYEGEGALYKIGKPRTMTYGRPDYPVYCAHEAAMELLSIRQNGKPFVVVEPAAKLGSEYCSVLIYKDPAKIPARYYERLGLEKP
jgi:hypothetical protein